ncbi:MAG TPA: transglycosylase SLT domain-containing protein [Bryobacteraceae bacterium]|nr:transglycosylase SLT domain-containing protein [Bryobacteraceae bacterium]
MRSRLRPSLASALLAVLGSAPGLAVSSARFVPSQTLPGIGVAREGISDSALAERVEQMIQSQTFAIMRDPQALAGAQRITSPRMQRLFQDAARKSGLPVSLLAAIAYLESWGDAKAVSPAGPKGIMQISEATARRIGLKVVHARRYRVTVTRKQVRNKRGKLVYVKYRRKERYEAIVRDDRLVPERALPAAAKYLARMEEHFGGRDWAVFAYHCGEGCVAEFRQLAGQAADSPAAPMSVARMFFSCSPAFHRELYDEIRRQMERDYSPTYWFRVMRAQQLLALYKEDPRAFRALAEEYRFRSNPSQRAPDRLSVWLTPADLETAAAGRALASAPDAPEFLGFRPPPGEPAMASPAALGTLVYIAYETRRLYDTAHPEGEAFVPLPVAALWHRGGPRNGLDEHSTGQVIDLTLEGVPAAERECLRFVLDDLGWSGNLGFIEEPENSRILHIGCSPTSRRFFSQVFEEAQAALRERVPEVTGQGA